MNKKFAILITTKNRLEDLKITLLKINHLIQRGDVECVIYDDGSNDETSLFVSSHYPEVKLHTNKQSKGYLYCRNAMLNATTANYAISLDDDAHFVIKYPLETIATTFTRYPQAGVLAFRIIWTKADDFEVATKDIQLQVQSFVGCGHVWRMDAWRAIPNYPEWFKFYGEENFATYELYKAKMEVMYLPEVLVQHRVELKSRKLQDDYEVRLRRSLFTGWSLIGMFYPKRVIPKRMAYSIWMQLKLKVFKGDMLAFNALIGAFWDLIVAIPKIISHRNGFSNQEFRAFEALEPAKIYWKG